MNEKVFFLSTYHPCYIVHLWHRESAGRLSDVFDNLKNIQKNITMCFKYIAKHIYIYIYMDVQKIYFIFSL
jgi:hypothetical protein